MKNIRQKILSLFGNPRDVVVYPQEIAGSSLGKLFKKFSLQKSSLFWIDTAGGLGVGFAISNPALSHKEIERWVEDQGVARCKIFTDYTVYIFMSFLGA